MRRLILLRLSIFNQVKDGLKFDYIVGIITYKIRFFAKRKLFFQQASNQHSCFFKINIQSIVLFFKESPWKLYKYK